MKVLREVRGTSEDSVWKHSWNMFALLPEHLLAQESWLQIPQMNWVDFLRPLSLLGSSSTWEGDQHPLPSKSFPLRKLFLQCYWSDRNKGRIAERRGQTGKGNKKEAKEKEGRLERVKKSSASAGEESGPAMHPGSPALLFPGRKQISSPQASKSPTSQNIHLKN